MYFRVKCTDCDEEFTFKHEFQAHWKKYHKPIE